MLESVCVSKNGRIRTSTGKRYNAYEYLKTVPASTGKRSNLSEYRKMVESERVLGKGRMRTGIEKLSQRVTENGRICLSTEKW